MPFLKEKWEALSEKAKKIVQIVLGIALALLSALSFWGSMADQNSFVYMLLALVAVLVMPNVAETQTGSKLPIMRRVLLISVLAIFVAFVIYMIASGKLIRN